MRRGIVVGIDSAAAGDGDGSNRRWAGDRQGIREGMSFGTGTAKPLYVRNKNREGIIPSLCAQEIPGRVQNGCDQTSAAQPVIAAPVGFDQLAPLPLGLEYVCHANRV